MQTNAQAVTDAPCVNFASELVAAYPTAKVILTKRDPDKWLKSIFHTYHRILTCKYFQLAAVLDPVLHPHPLPDLSLL